MKGPIPADGSFGGPDLLQELDLAEPLRDAGVMVWCVDLSQPDALVARMASLLAPDELDRAARFRVAADRHRFVVSHAALRIILGRECSLSPRALMFECSARGKPSLKTTVGALSLRFSLSHSADRAVVAVCSNREIGVDLEIVREVPDMAILAKSFFASAEQTAISTADDREQPRIFFRIWTRKEAVLKAAGLGITSGLRDPDVSVGLMSDAVDRGMEVHVAEKSWRLYELPLPPMFAGALAVETRPISGQAGLTGP